MNKIFIIIILFIILCSCDNRNSTQIIILSSSANQTYLNDESIIDISCKFISDNMYNQKIYFKTDNGFIRKNIDQQ